LRILELEMTEAGEVVEGSAVKEMRGLGVLEDGRGVHCVGDVIKTK
jgi:hypothetical protein